MDITRHEINLTLHALYRANEREVTPDLLFATIKGGKIERLGKHIIRFSREYKKFRVICIGKIFPKRIDIITVELVKK